MCGGGGRGERGDFVFHYCLYLPASFNHKLHDWIWGNPLPDPPQIVIFIISNSHTESFKGAKISRDPFLCVRRSKICHDKTFMGWQSTPAVLNTHPLFLTCFNCLRRPPRKSDIFQLCLMPTNCVWLLPVKCDTYVVFSAHQSCLTPSSCVRCPPVVSDAH